MVDPKKWYQDQLMIEYWQQRDGQAGHEEVYKGSSTYMMQQVGNLWYCNMQQRARKVKLMLDWGGHMADACDSWDWRRVANVPFA